MQQQASIHCVAAVAKSIAHDTAAASTLFAKAAATMRAQLANSTFLSSFARGTTLDLLQMSGALADQTAALKLTELVVAATKRHDTGNHGFFPLLLTVSESLATLSGDWQKSSVKDAISSLRLAFCRVARKTSNAATALRVLTPIPIDPLLLTPGNIPLVYEHAKLLAATGAGTKAFEMLSQVAVDACSRRSPVSTTPPFVRVLLRLAKWIELDAFPVNAVEQLDRVRNATQMLQPAEWEVLDVFGDSDTLAGRLLHVACTLAPSIAKCHAGYAAWCFKQARKCVSSSGTVQLTQSELRRMQHIVRDAWPALSPSQIEPLQKLLSTSQLALSEAAVQSEEFDDDIVEESQQTDTAALKATLLRRFTVLLAGSGTVDTATQLVDLWMAIQQRVQLLFKLAVASYFSYLQFESESELSLRVKLKPDPQNAHLLLVQ